MGKTAEITVHNNLIEYFKDLVNGAIRNQKLNTHEVAEFYVVNLLSEFHKSERIRLRCPTTGEDEPMAITYLRAVAASSQERLALLKNLGDRALYLSGLFADHLEATPVGLNYYMGMGGTAYTGVADLVGSVNSDLQVLYRELSYKFRAFVDVISEVSESAGFQNDSDLLKLYERWLKTGSERAARVLYKAGIPLNGPDPETSQ